MRFVHVVTTATGIGRVDDGEIALLDTPYPNLGALLQAGASMHALAGAAVRQRVPLDEVVLAAPLGTPRTIWGIGLNYRSKAEQTGRELPTEPILYVAAPTATLAPGASAPLPDGRTTEMDYEGEIAVVLGRRLYRADPSDIWPAVAGITASNDMTARDVMRATGVPTLAKSFPGFKPMGASVCTVDELTDRDAITVRTWVNGTLRQDDTSAGLIFPIPDLLARISWYAALEPGDVVLTGTPTGTGQDRREFLRPGDRIRIEVGPVLPLDTVVGPCAPRSGWPRHSPSRRVDPAILRRPLENPVTEVNAQFDLVLAGGTVLDPASGRNERCDVAVIGNKIAAIGPDLAPAAKSTVNCVGSTVVPGLVEGHTHIFQYVSKVGAPPEEAHLRRGVVAAADAGTAGASTFPAFRKLIVEGSDMRIVNFLNVSVFGLIDFRFGELLNPDTLVVDDALATAAENSDVVRGFKIRLSEDVVGPNWESLLKKSVSLADQAGLPLMVHIGETEEALPQVLTHLRPGDIVAHCYTGKPHGILDGDQVLPGVLAARERGVLFDSAHGKSNLSFEVARRAIACGFLPDILSSDTSARNWRGPVYDLLTSISKLVALGAPFAECIRRATVTPAATLGLDREGYGRLEVGGRADVTVLTETAEVVLPDAAGHSITAPRLEPTVIVHAGQLIEPTPWRGPVSA